VSNGLEKAYEIALVLRSQMQDEAAFEELLRLHSANLRRYIQYMLCDFKSSADDVAQEVWIQAYRGLPKLRDASAFPAWLYRIAHARISRQFHRRDLPFHGDECELMEELPTDETRVDGEELRHQLNRLSPDHREVLVLRFINDLSYEEMSRITREPLGTIRSRLHYAKCALRRALSQ
jgi:RNA polymerase sigma-70 factor (ECF subfamily)